MTCGPIKMAWDSRYSAGGVQASSRIRQHRGFSSRRQNQARRIRRPLAGAIIAARCVVLRIHRFAEFAPADISISS